MLKGNGESRKYVGSYTGSSGERLSDFFEYNDWGKEKKMVNEFILKFKKNAFSVRPIC